MIPCCIMAIENDDDREFMTSLYVNYNRLMYCEIRRIVETDFDAEDVMQDVLVKLIDKLPLLRSRERAQVVNYIISACRYTAFNHIRDHGKKRDTSFEDFMELADLDRDSHSLELHMIKGEELQALRRALGQLDQRSRELLRGYYFLDRSVSELGAELGVKPDSVRMLLSRARRKAFALMKKDREANVVGGS